MKTLTAKILLLAALLLGLAGMAVATEDTANQTVTITFSEISELAVSGNPVPLVIAAPATPGDLPADETDATTTMAWTCNVAAAQTRRITGSVNQLFNGINLYAEVTAAGSNGSSEGKTQFEEAGTDYDFVTGITNENTSGETITFTAEVSQMVAPYPATDKTVTWTLTEDG